MKNFHKNLREFKVSVPDRIENINLNISDANIICICRVVYSFT